MSTIATNIDETILEQLQFYAANCLKVLEKFADSKSLTEEEQKEWDLNFGKRESKLSVIMKLANLMQKAMNFKKNSGRISALFKRKAVKEAIRQEEASETKAPEQQVVIEQKQAALTNIGTHPADSCRAKRRAVELLFRKYKYKLQKKNLSAEHEKIDLEEYWRFLNYHVKMNRFGRWCLPHLG